MKNLINYLDEYFGENVDEQLCNRKFKGKIGGPSKEEATRIAIKANRKASRDEEIAAHGKPISYNRTFRDRSKYTRKEKHKNNY